MSSILTMPPPNPQADYDRRKKKLREDRQIRRELDAEERPPVPTPKAYTLHELLERPDEAVPWRIADLQPKGTRVMLAAQYKAGKTTLVGEIVRAVADGVPFLEAHAVEVIDGAIAILDFEMSEHQLQRWYRDKRIRRDDRVVIFPMRGLAASFNILDPKVRAEWATRLKGLNVRYLVLDCLRPVLDALGLDEHHDAGKFLGPFDALLTAADVPEALVVHHMGHTGERSRGDSRLRDWPDVEWRITREDDTDPASDRYFTAYGRDVEMPECALSYDPATRRLAVKGGSRKDKAASEVLPAVLAFIKAVPGATRNDIVKGLKGTHPQHVVKDAIKRGVERNLVRTEPGARNSHLHFLVTGDERLGPPVDAYEVQL